MRFRGSGTTPSSNRLRYRQDQLVNREMDGMNVAQPRDFLHRLPTAVAAHQRLTFESIGIAVEMIDISMSCLKFAAAKIIERRENLDLTRTERIGMLKDAWSIVDQMYALQKLIQSAGDEIDLASANALLVAAEPAARLRNWMDHPHQRLSNLPRRKSPIAPVYGILSFAFLLPEDLKPPEKAYGAWNVAMIMGSAMQVPLKAETLPEQYKTIRWPIDHFALQAFDGMLNLTSAHELAIGFGNDLAEKAERSFLKELSVRTAGRPDAGETLRKAMEARAEGSAWIMKVRER